jgi:uncharacterized heparinase superfamily protein
VPEQILADGGQFERSTMYHALALEDVLDLINLFAPPDGRCRQLGRRCGADGRLAGVMSHPDGRYRPVQRCGLRHRPIRTRNCGAMPPSLGIDAARSPSPQRRLLAESGYLRAEAANAVLILDVAPVGPDYLPGHAHADTLSFELSLFGQRVFCNGGTSRYGLGAGARSRARHGGTTPW